MYGSCDGPIALTGEIRDVVKARLNRLGNGQRDVFELLALAGAVPLQTLMLIANPQDMDALQERALIRVTHDHPPMVSIANPVTAGIVANVVPPGAARNSAAGSRPCWSDTLDTGGSAGVAWALDCGEEVSSEVALAAASWPTMPRIHLGAAFRRGGRRQRRPLAGAIENVHAHFAVNNEDPHGASCEALDGAARRWIPLPEWVTLQLLRVDWTTRSPAAAPRRRAGRSCIGSASPRSLADESRVAVRQPAGGCAWRSGTGRSPKDRYDEVLAQNRHAWTRGPGQPNQGS